MAGTTNRAKLRMLDIVYRGATPPGHFYLALVTAATAPTAATNTLSELTEIAAGNGYTAGGYELDRNSTDFDVLAEDDAGDQAYVQIKDVVWTASGGSIPSSGVGASYWVITDDNVTVGDREVWHWGALTGAPITQTAGFLLTLADVQINAVEG